jgi:carbonic anhydrase
MADINKLLNGYKEFYKKFYKQENNIFTELKDKQSPHTLLISCCDSRVEPAILLQVDPGEIFVIRNVANLVPPFEQKYDSKHGTSAAIEFSVKILGVKNIIILGHSNCGGIRAFVNSYINNYSNLHFVNGWIDILKDLKKQIPTTLNEKNLQKFCEKEAIKVSIQNLQSFPFVKEKIDNKEVNIHGWYFDIEEGVFYALNSDFKDFSLINPV